MLVRRAHVCSDPTVTAVTPVSTGEEGIDCRELRLVTGPSCPAAFQPQQNRLPLPAPLAWIPQVCCALLPDTTANHWPAGNGVMETVGVMEEENEIVEVMEEVTEIVGVLVAENVTEGVRERVRVQEYDIVVVPVWDKVGVLETVRVKEGVSEGVVV